MTGRLSFQIEHHLFPDLPSNRYGEIAPRVQAICQEYDLPYTTGPLLKQYATVWRTLARLSLPNGTAVVPTPLPAKRPRTAAA